jgi:HSP20 family protein
MLSEYAAPAARWPDMFRDLRRRQDNVGRVFGGLRLTPTVDFPPVNIWTSPDGAVVTAQLPGVSLDQIDVTVHKNTASIRGKRPPEVIEPDTIVHRQERPHGEFGRVVVLPFRVDAEKVSARFDRGVLKLELPRPDEDRPRKVRIAHA